MIRRLFFIPLLVLALLVPLGAQAKTLHFGTVSGPEPAKAPRATLHKARTALLDGQGVRKGADITPLLKELAVKLPSLTGAERKRAVDLLQRPSQGQGGFNELEYEVAEQPPLCSAHFCVHWVKSTEDAPPLADSNHDGTPDYVETMGGVFEHVYDVENVELGWKPPKSDGVRGCLGDPTPACTGKTDVY